MAAFSNSFIVAPEVTPEKLGKKGGNIAIF
jgi:hypothetical protein